MELKGEMMMQNALHLYDADVREILHALAERRDEAPQFFLHSSLVVDCATLGEDSVNIDFAELLSGLKGLSFVPVGIRHLSSAASMEKAIDAGWAILRDSISKSRAPESVAKKGKEDEKTKVKSEVKKNINNDNDTTAGATAASNDTSERVMVINRPVRSGQQVYAPDGDIVVLSQTSAGSELLAAGSVHVYGKLSGRVLAGVNGDRSVRIFCQGLNAELIAIAGHYQLLDEVDTKLKGQPAMISLEGDRLKIEPMV